MSNLNSLLDEFNSIKKESTDKSKILTDRSTLQGLDQINEMVADGMAKISQFADTGKEKGFFSKASSKALSIIDSENKWVGKWMNNAAERAEKEELKNKSISDIIGSIKTNIENKRNEVIEYIEAVIQLQQYNESTLARYKELEAEALAIHEQAEPGTRDSFDAKRLVNWIRGTIMELEEDLISTIKPLITNATIAVSEVDMALPSIEEGLQSKLGVKAAQQQLEDLTMMTRSVVELTSAVKSKLIEDVNATTLQSLEVIKQTGVNVKALSDRSAQQIAHQEKVARAIADIQVQVDKDFQSLGQLQLQIADKRAQTTTPMLGTVSTTGAR